MSAKKTGFDHQTGRSFNIRVSHGTGTDGENLTAKIVARGAQPGTPITDVVDIAWQNEERTAQISKFVLLGEDTLRLSSMQQYKRLGVCNGMNRDMRRRKYPSLPDHLANFDQQDIIDRRAFVGNATEQSTMIVKV